MYETCGMRTCANVVHWNGMQRNTLRWFSHLKRNKSEEFVKKVYVGKIES